MNNPPPPNIKVGIHASVVSSTGHGPVTIYPMFVNSTIQITEVAPDISKRITHWIAEWWYTRPCKHCEQVFKAHYEYTRGCGEHKTNPNLVWKTTYAPMDNLTYTEWLAKEKGLV